MANTEAAPASAKTWKLTFYEQHRRPHEVLQDETEVKVSPRSLHSELMCPICLDMLKSTMTTKECLHRFCQECITTALRSGNKECPTCRKKLVSRRSLRPDPTFDALISKIYPNRAEYEAHQERALAKLNKHHSTDALINNIEEGMRYQAIFRTHKGKRNSKINPATPTDLSAPESPASDLAVPSDPEPQAEVSTPKRRSQSGDMDEVEASTSGVVQSSPPSQSEIELVLNPHPENDASDESRYIKTTDNATVQHLKKYLRMRLNVEYSDAKSDETDDLFTVSILIGSNRTEVPPDTTLRHVNQHMWKQNKPLELYFKRNIVSD